MKGHNWGVCRNCGKIHGKHPMLGRHHTENSKEKNRLSNSGEKNGMYKDGKHPKHIPTGNPKGFQKGNKYCLGRHYSEETIKKMSQKRIDWYKFHKHPRGMKGKSNKWGKHNPETKRKISETRKILFKEGKLKPNSEVLKKMYKEGKLINPFKNKHHTEEEKEKMRKTWKYENHFTRETIEKMIFAHNTPEMKEMHRQIRKKIIIPKHHTKPELKFCRIIRRHNLPYKYTGDGSFWIENINPDFVQTNGKKICVEVFGDYWHNLPKQIEKDKQKLEILKKYGWQRIVIWEHELMKNINNKYL